MSVEGNNLVLTRDQSRIMVMFDSIASRYDLMNRLMTFGQDGPWRRLTADATELKAGDRVLDVATGTGDMARELARRVTPGGDVVGVDIAAAMLDVARSKTQAMPVQYVHTDVESMGYTEEFDAATVAFGLRNFARRQSGIDAMVKALRPGGRLVVLELVPAHGPLMRLAEVYEQHVIPFVGGLISGATEAYRYLPSSVAAAPSPPQIADMFLSARLVDVRWRTLNFGTVALVHGMKPGHLHETG